MTLYNLYWNTITIICVTKLYPIDIGIMLCRHGGRLNMDTGVASHEILYDNGATMSHTMLWRHRSRCGRLHRRYCRWRRCNVISILSLFFHYIFVVYILICIFHYRYQRHFNSCWHSYIVGTTLSLWSLTSLQCRS